MRSGGSGPGFAGKELGSRPGRLQRAPPQCPGQEKLSKQQPCHFHHLPQVPTTSRQGTTAWGRHAAPQHHHTGNGTVKVHSGGGRSLMKCLNKDSKTQGLTAGSPAPACAQEAAREPHSTKSSSTGLAALQLPSWGNNKCWPAPVFPPLCSSPFEQEKGQRRPA